MTTLIDFIQEKLKKARKERRDAATKERLMMALTEEHILPHMPNTLDTCFELKHLMPTYNGDGAHMTFAPTVDMGQDKTARRAVGTITKVANGLKRGGWEITTAPHATVQNFDNADKNMDIELVAHRRNENGPRSTLFMSFGGIKTTPNCRLVEKEVIVAAAYTPEHKTTRLVVECDDPEQDKQDHADAGHPDPEEAMAEAEARSGV